MPVFHSSTKESSDTLAQLPSVDIPEASPSIPLSDPPTPTSQSKRKLSTLSLGCTPLRCEPFSDYSIAVKTSKATRSNARSIPSVSPAPNPSQSLSTYPAFSTSLAPSTSPNPSPIPTLFPIPIPSTSSTSSAASSGITATGCKGSDVLMLDYDLVDTLAIPYEKAASVSVEASIPMCVVELERLPPQVSRIWRNYDYHLE